MTFELKIGLPLRPYSWPASSHQFRFLYLFCFKKNFGKLINIWQSDESVNMEVHGLAHIIGYTFGVRRLRLWPNNAGASEAALASGSASGGLQDGRFGLLVTVRYGSTLPGRRLSAGLRRRSSSAALCQLKDMCRQTDLQQLWRQMFCCCRS